MTSSPLPSLRDLLPHAWRCAVLAATLGLATPAHAVELTHRVESGQYLVLIAKRYHTTAEAIRKHNSLKRGQTLRPGMTLRIIETAEHRKWRAFLEGRAAKKRREKEKAEEARREKRRAERARREKARQEKERAREARRARIQAERARREKARREKRRAEKARRAERAQAAKARAAKARAKTKKPTPSPAATRPAEASPEEKAPAKQGAKKQAAKKQAARPKDEKAASRRRSNSADRRRAARRAKEAPRSDTLAPKRRTKPGLVTLRRHRQTLRTQLVRAGELVEQQAHRVDRLLRSLHTGETKPFDRTLLRHLATLSDHFGGRTIVVISGYRPGGEQPSRHQLGRAIDLRIEGVSAQQVFEQCRKLPHSGCGFYPKSSMVHLDTRERSRSWIDAAAPGEPPRYVEQWPPKER